MLIASELNEHGCVNLMNGTVVLASKDYMKALRGLKKNPNSKVSLAVVKECEEFFRSEWYTTLSSIDGEWLIRRLKEEAMKK